MDDDPAALLAELRSAMETANNAVARLVADDRVKALEGIGDEIWYDLLAVEDGHLRAVRAAGAIYKYFGGGD